MKTDTPDVHTHIACREEAILYRCGFFPLGNWVYFWKLSIANAVLLQGSHWSGSVGPHRLLGINIPSSWKWHILGKQNKTIPHCHFGITYWKLSLLWGSLNSSPETDVAARFPLPPLGVPFHTKKVAGTTEVRYRGPTVKNWIAKSLPTLPGCKHSFWPKELPTSLIMLLIRRLAACRSSEWLLFKSLAKSCWGESIGQQWAAVSRHYTTDTHHVKAGIERHPVS